jgi:hypothetical protein
MLIFVFMLKALRSSLPHWCVSTNRSPDPVRSTAVLRGRGHSIFRTLLLCFGLSLLPLQAAQITWTLQNVTFADGGTATGSFVVDTTLPFFSRVLSYNITTSGGNVTNFPSFTYENGVAPNELPSLSDSGELQLSTSLLNPNLPPQTGSRTLLLRFSESLLTAQGTVSVLTGFNSFECWSCSTLRTVSGGSAVPTFNAPIPEPGTCAMLAAGLAGLTLLRRRQA